MAANYQNTQPYLIAASSVGTVPQLSGAVSGSITTKNLGFTLSANQTPVVQTGGYIYNDSTKELRKITGITNPTPSSTPFPESTSQEISGGTIEHAFSTEMTAATFKYITAGDAQMKEVLLTTDPASTTAASIVDNTGTSRAVLFKGIPYPISKNGNDRSGTNATITPFIVDAISATGAGVSVIISY